MADIDLGDYRDVNERIVAFYKRYPDGRLTKHSDDGIVTIGERVFVKYTAAAYRTPDDPHPGVGTAWEPFPGRTPYTRDSELMNAETAAWGRAIVACGIIAKNESIASRQEVRNRREESPPPQQAARSPMTVAQKIAMVCRDAKIDRRELRKALTGKEHTEDITPAQAEHVLEVARGIQRGEYQFLLVGDQWQVLVEALPPPQSSDGVA